MYAGPTFPGFRRWRLEQFFNNLDVLLSICRPMGTARRARRPVRAKAPRQQPGAAAEDPGRGTVRACLHDRHEPQPRASVRSGAWQDKPKDESPTAAASVRMDTPSARADANAHLRSRSACSSRHAARDTRSSTRRSRRHAAVRSAIFMHTACPTCTVQQSGHAGGVHGVVLTDTPTTGGQLS